MGRATSVSSGTERSGWKGSSIPSSNCSHGFTIPTLMLCGGPLPYRGDPPHRLCSALLEQTDNNGSVDPVNGMYKTPRGLLIAADSVSWVATRSGGPGGQHANTSDTAVTITVDIERAGLSATVR